MEKGSEIQACDPPASIEDFPDDILEMILVQVPTPACLMCAAATCKAWRRVITGGGFLDRFRSIHGPRLVLGHYDIDFNETVRRGDECICTGFIPFPPRPATHLRHRLSLDFLLLPNGPFRNLLPTDSRGGLLAARASVLWSKLVVCHPYTRQYRVLYPPFTRPVYAPDEYTYVECKFLGAFFLGADDDDEAIRMSNFRVVYVTLVYDGYNDIVTAQAYVYSARDDDWIVLANPDDIVSHEHFAWDDGTLQMVVHRFMGRAGGSLFWSGHGGQVLQLDENTMEFSTFALPMALNDVGYHNDITCMREANYHRWNLRVVGGGGGAGAALRIVRIVDSDLEVFMRAHGDRECVLHKRVSLCQLANIKQVLPAEAEPWSFWETPSAGAPRLMASSSSYELCINVETMKPERINIYGNAARLLPYELSWPRNIISGGL